MIEVYYMYIVTLTITTLWADSAKDKLIIYIYFFCFPSKQGLTFHANCLHWRQFAWNVKTCFLEKKKTNIAENFTQSAKL